MAAGILWQKGWEEDRIVVNDKKGTLIYSRPRENDAKKMLDLKDIKLDGKEYEVKTYMAAPQSCGKGVSSQVKFIKQFRMGNSTSVIINFVNDYVPRWIICFRTLMKCFLYKKRYEVCYRCVKKRQWEIKLEEEREQEERRKAEEDTQRPSRADGVQDRSRRKSKHHSRSRGRSESFPRSPPLEKPGVSHKVPHDGGDCAQEID
ncbi:hypothetical protein HPB51_029309 [Rhipicephalus microplus]|uniref:Uncharacterized protein n=1 Tax=Rhipicephalus microplus TaxID=6941 RepID=A0A9J6CUX6_RHIMP|nr:hypothetical protein HPB51_029309 [Rhipicephalus microplus]